MAIPDNAKIEVGHSRKGNQPTLNVYNIEYRTILGTKEITIYEHLEGAHTWSGDILEYGEWRELDLDELDYCIEFLKEKGYLE